MILLQVHVRDDTKLFTRASMHGFLQQIKNTLISNFDLIQYDSKVVIDLFFRRLSVLTLSYSITYAWAIIRIFRNLQ